ncbi:uncharacterized protein LOC122041209 [Zingiber officinale]|uniref:uncharacterized protein LOC122041209 n=1 Tax=Zingiber officinale TaxID=94328 RepID=UPI001C4D428E|nr:uncharacterized protein LOC122041209 [Zingiber officinale]
MEVNVPLLTMIKQILKYTKFLKDLCVHKNKLKGSELISTGKNVVALIQPVPQKYEDPGVFTVSCMIASCVFEDAMLDLGASINVMTESVFQILGIGPLQSAGVVIQFANRSQAHPARVIEDVLVNVRELIFPIDFYILDMQGDLLANKSPVILGRPFLKTTRTKIDVHTGTLSMEIADTFDISNSDEFRYVSEDSAHVNGDFGAIELKPICELFSFKGECVSVVDCTVEAISQESYLLIGVSPKSFKGYCVSVGDYTVEAIPQESLPLVIQSQPLELKPLPEQLKYTFLREDQ